ncbi:biopolymer transporter ExbD [soil metagenome]
MAEMQTPVNRKQKGHGRSKKLSTKVDLTPMVDLGFLLITFFVFTATLTQSKVMKIALPDKGDDAITAAGKTISLLIAANNIVYYYNGDSLNNIHVTNFSAQGLREVIRNKKAAVQAKYGSGNESVVLIKPTDNAVYSNIVDALDEMEINVINRYVLMDASANENTIVENIK